MATKHIIWSNDTDQFDDTEIRTSLMEREFSENEITDDAVENEKRELVDIYFDDETSNLNRPLRGRVLCIADLGLWHGRKSGYRIMKANLNEVLNAFQGDYCEVYFDGRNVKATDTHHDGTNVYTFREIREDRNIDRLLAKLYAGTATSRDISAYTRSLAPAVCEVYGWKYAYAKKQKQPLAIRRAA